MIEFILLIVVLLIVGFTVLPILIGYIKQGERAFNHVWVTLIAIFATYALLDDIYIKIKKRYSQTYTKEFNALKNRIPSTGTLFAILILFILFMSFFSLNK